MTRILRARDGDLLVEGEADFVRMIRDLASESRQGVMNHHRVDRSDRSKEREQKDQNHSAGQACPRSAGFVQSNLRHVAILAHGDQKWSAAMTSPPPSSVLATNEIGIEPPGWAIAVETRTRTS